MFKIYFSSLILPVSTQRFRSCSESDCSSPSPYFRSLRTPRFCRLESRSEQAPPSRSEIVLFKEMKIESIYEMNVAPLSLSSDVGAKFSLLVRLRPRRAFPFSHYFHPAVRTSVPTLPAMQRSTDR